MITFGIIAWLFSGVVSFFLNIGNVITFVEDFLVVTWKVARVLWYVGAFIGHLLAGPAGILLNYINNKTL